MTLTVLPCDHPIEDYFQAHITNQEGINPQYLIEGMIEGYETAYPELIAWCEENCSPGQWGAYEQRFNSHDAYYLAEIVVGFVLEEDALRFKLTFLGEERFQDLKLECLAISSSKKS